MQKVMAITRPMEEADRTLIHQRSEPGIISQELEGASPSPEQIHFDAIRLRIIITIMNRVNGSGAIEASSNGIWIDIASLLDHEPFAVAINITDEELDGVIEELERRVGVVISKERDEVFLRSHHDHQEAVRKRFRHLKPASIFSATRLCFGQAVGRELGSAD